MTEHAAMTSAQPSHCWGSLGVLSTLEARNIPGAAQHFTGKRWAQGAQIIAGPTPGQDNHLQHRARTKPIPWHSSKKECSEEVYRFYFYRSQLVTTNVVTYTAHASPWVFSEHHSGESCFRQRPNKS